MRSLGSRESWETTLGRGAEVWLCKVRLPSRCHSDKQPVACSGQELSRKQPVGEGAPRAEADRDSVRGEPAVHLQSITGRMALQADSDRSRQSGAARAGKDSERDRGLD